MTLTILLALLTPPQLILQITSKSYRISALEAQLESSTRDYSREIARLRTKLFELEITAAMANDRPGSSAGTYIHAVSTVFIVVFTRHSLTLIHNSFQSISHA